MYFCNKIMDMDHGNGKLILECCAILLSLAMINRHCPLKRFKDGFNRMGIVC